MREGVFGCTTLRNISITCCSSVKVSATNESLVLRETSVMLQNMEESNAATGRHRSSDSTALLINARKGLGIRRQNRFVQLKSLKNWWLRSSSTPLPGQQHKRLLASFVQSCIMRSCASGGTSGPKTWKTVGHQTKRIANCVRHK